MVQMSPHQIKAMGDLGNGKILRGSVGSGKSRISIAYFVARVTKSRFKINGKGDTSDPVEPRPLYIITTAKKRDDGEWVGELANFGIQADESGGWLGAPVVIDSWNNISKYKAVEGAFFIFDEQRLVGSGAWVRSFYRISRRNQWIILTATPGDDWQDYIPVFVANGFYRTRSQFLQTHAVYNTYANYPKIDRWVDTAKLHEFRERVLVNVDYETHATRHLKHIPTLYDEALWNRVRKDRWNPWEDRPIQDAGELFRLMRQVVNQDPSRLKELGKLLSIHPKLIVFYNFNYELDALRGFAQDIGVTHAEWNGQKHMAIPEADSWLYLVQYTAGSEGWNCIETDALIFYSLTYSYKQFEQAQGRIDRMNSPYLDLYYYIFRSKSEIDDAVWKALLRKQSFNEKAYMKRIDNE